MSTDLNNLIRTQMLEERMIVLITYQILRALKYLHSGNIVHRVIQYLCFVCL